MSKWRETNDLFGNAGIEVNSIDEYAELVEQAFGWRPVIQDNGFIRTYTKHTGDGSSYGIFEGEGEFDYLEWLRSPNWLQLLGPVGDE